LPTRAELLDLVDDVLLTDGREPRGGARFAAAPLG
jgi:hypothetical protein